MATRASEISTTTPEPQRSGPAHAGGTLIARLGITPAAVASAALFCLLIGLVLVAVQIKAIFSDQLKQEYTGMVLDAVGRAESARDLASAWQPLAGDSANQPEHYRHARADLAARLTSLAALVQASPVAAPRMPTLVLSPDANFDTADAVLREQAVYWRAQRDLVNSALHTRITHVARTLIVLSALLFGVLITALGMYAKRTRQLAGESHRFEHAALHDAMTGLPNRRQLFAMLAQAADSAQRETPQRKIAVLYVDLDGFKKVNDSLGHPLGDEFLIAVSRRFRQSVRQRDVVARIGGDEFAVLVRGFAADEELGVIAERLIGCVVQTDEQMGIGFVRASIGIASYPEPVDDYRRLLATADETMYEVKRRGKNGYAFAARTEPAN
ncbi:GGDEF domain-containing protein [Paraburkholderia sp.]|jgi:diguanylate cyclase (GGDEF)-like protein|uniref:GGDEF domain-containing protein n=1 Tax=Paraburkholderia sp. TaxID=1926495 RepID=UPI002F42C70C